MHNFKRSFSIHPRTGMEFCRFDKLIQNFPAHFHEHYLLGCLSMGKRRLLHSGNESLLKAGDFVFAPPWRPHACACADREESAWLALHIPRNLMAALSPDAAAINSILIPDQHFGVWFMELFTIVENDPEAALSGLQSFLHELANSNPHNSVAASPKDAPIARLCALMEQDLSRQMPLERMSDLTGMGKYRLVRAFNTVTGMSPQRYHAVLRLNKARAMLWAGAGICESGLECGYYDQPHFCRRFKENFGITPGEYKMAARAGAFR